MKRQEGAIGHGLHSCKRPFASLWSFALVTLALTRLAPAQEPVWSFRAGGVLISNEQSAPLNSGTHVTLDKAQPFVSFDVMRVLGPCCLEVFASTVIPRVSVQLTGPKSTETWMRTVIPSLASGAVTHG
jgi:hypothetical protein